MDWRCHPFPHPSKQQEPEPDPAPEVPAVPRTAEEPNAKAIADAAAAAVAKAGEDDFRAGNQAGERRGAKNLQTALPKGFGCGLASKLRSEGSPFDASYSASLRSTVASIVAAWFF